MPASPNLIYNGGGGNLIHLGFDVEGSPAYLGELLDVLDRRGVKTTMYILGSWAENYPNWVQTFAQRGHELGNHAYSHANMNDLTPQQIKDELNQTEQIIRNLTGQSSKPYFRPPYGSRSDASVQAAYEAGWSTIIWSGSSEDWRGDETNANLMCQTMRQGAFPGSILYTHTYRADMPEAVDRFIGEMQSRGYIFVPVSVILAGG